MGDARSGWSQENHPSAAARTRMRYSRLKSHRRRRRGRHAVLCETTKPTQREVTNDHQILGRVLRPDATGILGKRGIQAPVEAVLDCPVGTNLRRRWFPPPVRRCHRCSPPAPRGWNQIQPQPRCGGTRIRRAPSDRRTRGGDHRRRSKSEPPRKSMFISENRASDRNPLLV
jgi:hypothetical protein